MKSLLFAILLFLCFPVLFFAQSGGESTYQVLKLPLNSRISGIGGRNVSHYANDLNFVMQNPAFLRPTMTDKLALNYCNYIEEINIGSVAFAKNFEKAGIFSAGIQFANYGKMTNADYTGVIMGEFMVSDYILFGSYSREIKKYPKLRYGATLKLIMSDYWKYSSFGMAVDAGICYLDTLSNFSVGLVISNLGTQLKAYTKGNYEKLPIDLAIGITKKFNHAPIRIHVTMQDLTNWNLHFKSKFNTDNQVIGEEAPKKTFLTKLGAVSSEFIRHFVFAAEIVPHKAFHIDFGFNTRRRMDMIVPVKKRLAGFSAGIGLDLRKFNFGYGIAIYHLAGLTHSVSIGLNLNEFYKKK